MVRTQEETKPYQYLEIMIIEEYDKMQHHENNYQVAIDFDGVVHGNSKGFHDGTVYDPPIEGSLDAIKWFKSQGYDIVLFTAKVKPDRPLVNGKTGKELIWEWLRKYKIDTYICLLYTSPSPRDS